MQRYWEPLTAEDVSSLVHIGHVQDDVSKTGVTVLWFPNGATIGCDVSGGGPASRETTLASPLTANNPVNAVVLSGGSAFGLAASDGVVQCLEEQGIGFDTGAAVVPLVCQSCIYDLGYGDASVRPDRKMGYEACRIALKGTSAEVGNVGAGTGATVGKICGMQRASKAGFGFAAYKIGELRIAAAVVVNALGDVTDPRTGERLAGVHSPDRLRFSDTLEELLQIAEVSFHRRTNTTIGCVVTNAALQKAEAGKLASMTRAAYARCIRPVGTLADGDTIYAAATGEIQTDLSVLGAFSSKVMEEAICCAVRSASISESEYLREVR
jgi:L-aminopeptidase/D-esterase-like protein